MPATNARVKLVFFIFSTGYRPARSNTDPHSPAPELGWGEHLGLATVEGLVRGMVEELGLEVDQVPVVGGPWRQAGCDA